MSAIDFRQRTRPWCDQKPGNEVEKRLHYDAVQSREFNVCGVGTCSRRLVAVAKSGEANAREAEVDPYFRASER